MQIKSIRSYHFLAPRMALIKKHNNKWCLDWRNYNPHTLLVGTATLENHLAVPQKVKR